MGDTYFPCPLGADAASSMRSISAGAIAKNQLSVASVLIAACAIRLSESGPCVVGAPKKTLHQALICDSSGSRHGSRGVVLPHPAAPGQLVLASNSRFTPFVKTPEESALLHPLKPIGFLRPIKQQHRDFTLLFDDFRHVQPFSSFFFRCVLSVLISFDISVAL